MSRNSREAICEKNPWVSRSMGVSPDQVKQVREEMKRHGVRAQVSDRGEIVCTSKAARNDAMKFFGVVDRDGGYSDHTG